MPQKLTAAECHARASALESCAEFLGLDWTDHSADRVQGDLVAVQLRAQSLKYYRLGDGRISSEDPPAAQAA